MAPDKNRFRGVVLGLAYGDALGAPHEGGMLEKLLWRLIGRTGKGEIRWTDDTQMAVDVAEVLLSCGGIEQQKLAEQFARSYRWSRGYGAGTAKVLRRVARGKDWRAAAQSAHKGGSWGNGGAMRAPVIPLYYCNSNGDDMLLAVQKATEVTHAHPLAFEGAALVALHVDGALKNQSCEAVCDEFARRFPDSKFLVRIDTLAGWLASGHSVSSAEAAKTLGNGIGALDSCPLAVFIAHTFRDAPFSALVDYAIACKGDVDTIAAMAGAIWGAYAGAERLGELREPLEAKDFLLALADRLHDAAFRARE